MTSAWSITASVNPPRAAFVDFPLGHTTGKALDVEGQLRILRGALAAFTSITEPGTIVDLGEVWGDDGWRVNPLGGGSSGRRAKGEAGGSGGDSRVARDPNPQYQTEEDRRLAEARHGPEVACRACVGFDA